MLKEFAKQDNRSILINPAFVRAVEPYGNGQTGMTILHFGPNDFIVVQGNWRIIGDTIDAA